MRKVTISYPVLTKDQHEMMVKKSGKSNYKELYQATTGIQHKGDLESCWYYDKKLYYFGGWDKLEVRDTTMYRTQETFFEGLSSVRLVYPELTAVEFEQLASAKKEDFPEVFKKITGQKFEGYQSVWMFSDMFFHTNAQAEKIDKISVWHDPAAVTRDPWPVKEGELTPLKLSERFRKVSEHSIDVLEDNGLRTTFNFMMQHVVVDNQKPGTAPTVMNFDDVQRQSAITEAYQKLIELGGNPPDPSVVDMPGKARTSGLSGLGGRTR